MLNTPIVRRALLTIAAALLVAAQPGATRPAPQRSPAGGAGQTAAPQAPAQPAGPANAAPPATPVVRVTSRLVQVSVVAHDGHGNPITDLTQEDFRLFDNGQEQKISFFSKDSSEVRAGEAPVLAADTWSNVSFRSGSVPVNLTVILFDQVNTQAADQASARTQIIRFLNQMRPEDRIALYALGDGIRVLHDFTSDAASLIQALARAKARNGRLVPENDSALGSIGDTSGDPDLDSFLAAADTAFTQYQVTDRVLRTTDALEAIAAHVGRLPGRKNLLWVSGAFPLMIGYDVDSSKAQAPGLDTRSFLVEVDRAGRALNEANMAVYPVDAHQLRANISAFGVTPPPSTRPSLAATRPTTIIGDRSGVDTMENIAARTGGVAYHDTNDLSGAIRSAIDDSRVVYTLSYAPSHNEWDSKFRKIKVETRRSGVHLRFRSGYFAFPDVHLDSEQRTQMLAEAQWSAFDATQIPLTLQIVRVTNNDKPAIKFAILADSSGLRFTETEGRHDTDMLLTLGQKGPDGKLVQEQTKTLTFRLKDEAYREVMAKGMRLTATIPLDPAATSFRIVLLDAADGHLGSMEVPIAKMRTEGAPGAPAAPTTPATGKPGTE